MFSLIFMFIFSIFIPTLLALLAISVGKKSMKDREKLSPFECGFDPCKKARIPFSLPFFLVTIIFLIFDVEIALLLPLGLVFFTTNPPILTMVFILIMTILTLGLFYEWLMGSLNWIY